MTGRITDTVLDALFPYVGPCGLCGCGDARHRLFDSIRDAVRADGVEVAARDYGCTVDQARIISERWPAACAEWEDS